jgi:putative tricarboxylic transport membrane protein
MEFRLREAMAISGGDASGLLSEPLAVVIYVLVAVVVLAPLVLRAVRPAHTEPSTDERDEELVER